MLGTDTLIPGTDTPTLGTDKPIDGVFGAETPGRDTLISGFVLCTDRLISGVPDDGVADGLGELAAWASACPPAISAMPRPGSTARAIATPLKR